MTASASPIRSGGAGDTSPASHAPAPRGFIDRSCDRCRRKYGWFGTLADDPGCEWCAAGTRVREHRRATIPPWATRTTSKDLHQ